MKESARYAKIVEWSEEDHCFVGSSPGLVYGGCHGADEQRVATTGHHVPGLPAAGRHDELHALAGRGSAAHEHVLAVSVGMQEHKAQRIAAVEVPDLVDRQAVEQRQAQWLITVQADHRRRCARRAAVGGREQRALNRQRLQAVVRHQRLDLG